VKDNKIKILQLGSPTGLYGAERWILALINNIRKKDIEIVVAVIKDDPGLNADICKEAEKIGVSTKIFNAYGRVNFSAVRQVKEYILKHNINILHTHGYKTDIIGLFARYGTGCKLVTTPHGWSKNAGFKLKVYEVVDRFSFHFFDAVVPLSEEIYDGLKRVPFLGKKLQIIMNGVDIKDIDNIKKVSAEMVDWKVRNYFVIGYIGQLIERKGLDVLLKSVSSLKDIEWRLAIIGDGSEKDKLVRLSNILNIEDRVRFFGFREDRISFLRGFDIFVLPSRLEGVPRCVMEAMAANIPVIVSDIPGCRDLIKQQETGLLFRPDDVDALCQAVRILFTNNALRVLLSDNARKAVENNWSALAMAERYCKLYDKLKNG
jgi:glycosyltransferase involved in cell wall biosynthesis